MFRLLRKRDGIMNLTKETEIDTAIQMLKTELILLDVSDNDIRGITEMLQHNRLNKTINIYSVMIGLVEMYQEIHNRNIEELETTATKDYLIKHLKSKGIIWRGYTG